MSVREETPPAPEIFIIPRGRECYNSFPPIRNLSIMSDEHASGKGSVQRNWVSLIPFGLHQQHPNNYKDILDAVWENRDSLGYAYRILRDGCCDGCSLGTSGMHDWTMKDLHLC